MSLSERAYHQIRHMIVRLELAPGDVIREDGLQARLGLGRTPIREALQRLVRDQFVVVLPRRGMYVANVDLADLGLPDNVGFAGTPHIMRPPLAKTKVRFVGDIVAAVVATDLYKAQDAAERVNVSYETLPPLVKMADARAVASSVDAATSAFARECTGNFATDAAATSERAGARRLRQSGSRSVGPGDVGVASC